jgi:pyruvate/2-oxoacid:ferredoxin oxidoreductase alpha subunit
LKNQLLSINDDDEKPKTIVVVGGWGFVIQTLLSMNDNNNDDMKMKIFNVQTNQWQKESVVELNEDLTTITIIDDNNNNNNCVVVENVDLLVVCDIRQDAR